MFTVSFVLPRSKRSWEGYSRRCTSVLVSKTLLVSVCALTSEHDVASFENVVGQVPSVPREARFMSAERFCKAGESNVELDMHDNG